MYNVHMQKCLTPRREPELGQTRITTGFIIR